MDNLSVNDSTRANSMLPPYPNIPGMGNNRMEIHNIRRIEEIANREEATANLETEVTKNGVCVCKRDNCPYIHDKKKADICKHFFNHRECNRGDNCDFRHDLDDGEFSKIQCKFFREKGYCKNGSKCTFKHSKKICKFYDRGFCPLGDTCIEIHSIKKLCSSYMYGFCPKGPQCKSFHPKQFYQFDVMFWMRMNRDINIVRCYRCQAIGHKSNNCDKEVVFLDNDVSHPINMS